MGDVSTPVLPLLLPSRMPLVTEKLIFPNIYDYDETGESFELKHPRSDIKVGERILTFWQVYNLDRCLFVVLRKPAVIPDNMYSITFHSLS